MSEVEMCAKSSLVPIRTPADKIRFQPRSPGMLVTLSPRPLQASSRSDYPFLLPVGIAKGSVGCGPGTCLGMAGAGSSKADAVGVER